MELTSFSQSFHWISFSCLLVIFVHRGSSFLTPNYRLLDSIDYEFTASKDNLRVACDASSLKHSSRYLRLEQVHPYNNEFISQHQNITGPYSVEVFIDKHDYDTSFNSHWSCYYKSPDDKQLLLLVHSVEIRVPPVPITEQMMSCVSPDLAKLNCTWTYLANMTPEAVTHYNVTYLPTYKDGLQLHRCNVNMSCSPNDTFTGCNIPGEKCNDVYYPNICTSCTYQIHITAWNDYGSDTYVIDIDPVKYVRPKTLSNSVHSSSIDNITVSYRMAHELLFARCVVADIRYWRVDTVANEVHVQTPLLHTDHELDEDKDRITLNNTDAFAKYNISTRIRTAESCASRPYELTGYWSHNVSVLVRTPPTSESLLTVQSVTHHHQHTFAACMLEWLPSQCGPQPLCCLTNQTTMYKTMANY